MDLPALYDEDIHAWALHQAAVIRRFSASGIPLPNDFDLEHVAEEIESLGNEQRFQVESHIMQAMMHLLKAARDPDSPDIAHWFAEIVAFLGTAEDRFTPSMRRAMDLDKLWDKARRRLSQQRLLGRADLAALPAECPFTLDDFVGGRSDPRDLAARLAALFRDEA